MISFSYYFAVFCRGFCRLQRVTRFYFTMSLPACIKLMPDNRNKLLQEEVVKRKWKYIFHWYMYVCVYVCVYERETAYIHTVYTYLYIYEVKLAGYRAGKSKTWTFQEALTNPPLSTSSLGSGRFLDDRCWVFQAAVKHLDRAFYWFDRAL